MDDDEINRNKKALTFQPCSVCRAEGGAGGVYEAPQKIKNYHVSEK